TTRKGLSLVPVILTVLLFTVSPLATASVITTSAASGSQVQPLVVVDRTALAPACSQTGLCPAMLEKAYGFDVLQGSGTAGAGQTVVIDDACGDPNIATDLSAFDAQFGLSNPTLNVI